MKRFWVSRFNQAANIFFIFNAFLLLLVSLLLTGCSTNGPSGTIYVGRPALYTRERLVNTRLQDIQWLQGQLSRDASSTFQGARSQLEASGFSGSLQAQFDPLAAGGALGASQTAQSAQIASQLQNQIVASALQQKLHDVQNGILAYSNILGTNVMTTANTASNSPFSPPANLNLGPTSWTNLIGLPSPSNIVLVTSNVQLTAEEQFRDKLAYRDAVEAELSNRQLDDSHDHFGMTLYTLKFDISIIPGDANSAIGRVDVSLNPCTCANPNLDENQKKLQYQQWFKRFLQAYDTESLSLQRRYKQGYLTDQERETLVFRLLTLDKDLATEIAISHPTDDTTSNPRSTMNYENGEPRASHGILSGIKSLFSGRNMVASNTRVQTTAESRSDAAIPTTNSLTNSTTNSLQAEINNGKIKEDITTESLRDNQPAIVTGLRTVEISLNDADQVLKALDYMTFYRLKRIFRVLGYSNLFHFKDTLPTRDENGDVIYMTFINPDPENGPNELENLKKVLEEQTKGRTFVYEVEPKEQAQNLSDTSARLNAINLSLSLSAAIPQVGTSLGTFLNYAIGLCT